MKVTLLTGGRTSTVQCEASDAIGHLKRLFAVEEKLDLAVEDVSEYVDQHWELSAKDGTVLDDVTTLAAIGITEEDMVMRLGLRVFVLVSNVAGKEVVMRLGMHESMNKVHEKIGPEFKIRPGGFQLHLHGEPIMLRQKVHRVDGLQPSGHKPLEMPRLEIVDVSKSLVDVTKRPRFWDDA